MNFEEKSMIAVFENQAAKYGESKAIVAYKKDGKFQDITWKEFREQVRNLASELVAMGIKSGDKLAIFSENRYEWWIADLAAQTLGAAIATIYATNTENETHYILEHSDSVLCFVGKKSHAEKVIACQKKLPLLKNIISFDDLNFSEVKNLSSVLKEGAKKRNDQMLDQSIASLDENSLASLMYTSGTTGAPKGVMITFKNFKENARQANEALPIGEKDVFLSFLPLSHAFERLTGYYTPIMAGSKVYFAESFRQISEDMRVVRPTIFVSVPRLFEKVYAGVMANLNQASALKSVIVKWSLRQAKRNVPYVCNDKKRKGFFATKYALADKLVLGKLRVALGMDRANFYVSGGGPLAVEYVNFFIGIGLHIVEGFGMTECSPVTNVNRVNRIKPGTVGEAFIDTEIKIADDGELLIKGPQVMAGYYKNEQATKETFTSDGYLKSGDIAMLDDEGFLSITGRIKDIIVTAGGKNISPQNIENSIKNSNFIEHIALIGDQRKFVSAIIIPAKPELEKWAKSAGIEYQQYEELLKNEKVFEKISLEIDEHTKHFARVEQVKVFRLLADDWSQDTGELTPTLKVKRKVIEQKYANLINELYANAVK